MTYQPQGGTAAQEDSEAAETGGSASPVESDGAGDPLPTAPPAPQQTPPSSRYLNRHLSWLDFDDRVLQLAEDPSLPLLERVKFLAIFSQNLDEFFQVRLAELDEQVETGITLPSPDGLTPSEQLTGVRGRVRSLMARLERAYVDRLAVELREEGIELTAWDDLQEADRHYLESTFQSSIFPVLTPLSVDPAHPFPYISSLSLNLAVVVRDRETRIPRFARVKVPPLLPRLVPLPDGRRWVWVEQIIAAHLQSLFPGMEVAAHPAFRITRNADPEVREGEETQDLRAAIEMALQRRRRSRHTVRLEIESSMSNEVRGLLVRELDLDPADVYLTDGPIDLGGLWEVYGLDRPDLKYPSWASVTQPRLAGPSDEPVDIFRILRDGDVLVHHPYDSFATSVEAFIERAAADPGVLAIKQTLYRTSGPESAIVRSLIRAAEDGKQVVALVELKARFDEEANIAWASALEKAGVHVVYGVVGLKTHAKISLVVRREDDGIRRYCHIGTGNYNPNTARIYEDVGLMTADPDIGTDVADLFNYLTGYSRKVRYRHLQVAPLTLRSSLVDMIREEAAQPDGHIVMKVNSISDPALIDALYEASEAGARIDLVVRGICCLRPCVPGLSSRIRVRSLVGRFLEHSRIFRFGSSERGTRSYLGSADLMTRNLDYRVEAVLPVLDPELEARLGEILRICLDADVSAWELGPDGRWSKVPASARLNAQEEFMRLAVELTRQKAVAKGA